MPKLILCRGIQGSGKTTWAKQWVYVLKGTLKEKILLVKK